ncbi:MAG TPA: hypothetical protein VFW40_10200, partial [Capsulimonadaceae bacterium]|nr:hypothetical protein [Capsulimonadaceae bacterium]
ITTWLASYGSGTGSTHFELEITQEPMKKPKPGKNSDMPDYAFGEGAFIHLPGSNSAGLLQALGKVLEAKSVPGHVKRENRLPFTYVVLGENQTRMPDGSFADSPPGGWKAMKLFLGDDDGEFFFNLDPKSGQAEITEKDPDYGDYDIKQLASVL